MLDLFNELVAPPVDFILCIGKRRTFATALVDLLAFDNALQVRIGSGPAWEHGAADLAESEKSVCAASSSSVISERWPDGNACR